MHLLFQDGSGTQAFSLFVSWVIVIGAAYGCIRLVVDVWRIIRLGMAENRRITESRERAAEEIRRGERAEP